MNATVTMRQVIEVDWIALSKAVEVEVMSKLNEELVQWQNDTAMRAMFLHDAADGLDVCVLLSKGKWLEVEKRLYSMDTASREWVWDWIEKHSCDNLFGILRGQVA